MALAKVYTIDYTDGGDTVKEGVEKLDDEFTTLYTIVDNLHKCHYGAAGPSNKQTGTLWMDSADDTLYYWDGSSWSGVLTGEYASGLSLDDALDLYTRNVFLTMNADGDNIDLVASAAAPATVEAGGEVGQNTATVQVDMSGLAADTYDIYAIKVAGTLAFTIGAASSPYTLGATERKIGKAKLSALGTVEWIESDEAVTPARAARPYCAFRAVCTQGAATDVALTTSYVAVKFDTEDYDTDGCFDGTTNFDYTAKKAGLHTFTYKIAYSVSDPGWIIAQLQKGGTAVSSIQIDGPSTGGSEKPVLGETVTLDLAVGDVIDVKMKRHTDVSTALYYTENYGSFGSVGLTAFEGRFLGPLDGE